MSLAPAKPFRVEYSEIEAADVLGISVEHLRTLVQNHIVREEPAVTVASFQQSDLLVLRLLAGIPAGRVHSETR